jgi:hypothetical protein
MSLILTVSVTVLINLPFVRHVVPIVCICTVSIIYHDIRILTITLLNSRIGGAHRLQPLYICDSCHVVQLAGFDRLWTLHLASIL